MRMHSIRVHLSATDIMSTAAQTWVELPSKSYPVLVILPHFAETLVTLNPIVQVRARVKQVVYLLLMLEV